jgi:hypothetical protein
VTKLTICLMATALALGLRGTAMAQQTTTAPIHFGADDPFGLKFFSLKREETQQASILWETDLDQARRRAKIAHKPLVVYFRMENEAQENSVEAALQIAACTRLESEVFTSRDFQAYGSQAIFVRQTVSKLGLKGLAADLLALERIESFPATVVYEVVDNAIIGRARVVDALLEPADYLRQFRAAFAKCAPSAIRWETNIIDGYERAKAEKKPLVVYFPHSSDVPSQEDSIAASIRLAIEASVLGNPDFQAYADRAVFVRQNESHRDSDGLAARIVNQLNIKVYPMVVVFDIAPDELVPRGAVEGMTLNAKEFLLNFRAVFENGSASAAPTSTKEDADYVPQAPPDFAQFYKERAQTNSGVESTKTASEPHSKPNDSGAKGGPTVVDLDDVPAPARRAAAMAVPGGTWRLAYKMPDAGWYKFVGEDVDKHTVEFFADPKGQASYIRAAISRNEVPTEVWSALEAKVPGFRPTKIEACGPSIHRISVYRFQGEGYQGVNAGIYVREDGGKVQLFKK